MQPSDKRLEDLKYRLERLSSIARRLALASAEKTNTLIEYGKQWTEIHGPELKKALGDVREASAEFFGEAYHTGKDAAEGLYDRVRYSREKLQSLERLILYQGGYYRELNRRSQKTDTIMLGGESLVALTLATHIPDAIEKAYEAAYPTLAASVSLRDRLTELEGDQLQGLVSGIKGKLFEMKYVDFLNEGNLPDGYQAVLADLANQPGWDLRIEGPNGEIVDVLQAKATDSLWYVRNALEQNPSIDVVTTEEVYSHLVMSGVSEGIVDSSISNESLNAAMDSAVGATDIQLGFAPPWFTMALIAFTTYKDDSLTLYQKARSAGGRSGKSYLSFLVGGAVGAISNTWWLGVVGTVASRYLSDEGQRRRAIFEKLKEVAKNNHVVLARMQPDAQ